MDQLNGQFQNEIEYFERVLLFLNEYVWVFRSPNTHIFVDEITELIPKEWTQLIKFKNWNDISVILQGSDQPISWPSDLKTFLTYCRHLSLRMVNETKFCDVTNTPRKWKKINPKKIHEVVNLGQIIGQHCQRTGVTHVVDFGSGLGYLDRELNLQYQLSVLGLEQDSYRVAEASKRTVESSETSCAGVIFKECTLQHETDLHEKVDHIVDQWLEEVNVHPGDGIRMSAVGLHACGDLSPSILKLFLSSRQPFHSLFLVSCCYHRMNCSDDGKYHHFPMSNSLSTLCQRRGALSWTNHLKYFLRLAAQETTNHWLKDLPDCSHQLQSTFYRAILQLYACRENLHLKKRQRKAVKNMKQSMTFEEYAEEAIDGFGLQDDAETHRQRLLNLFRSHQHLMPLVETLIILQVLLQPVAEALILLDRVLFLEEKNCCVQLVQAFNDKLSPRCFLTMAEKK